MYMLSKRSCDFKKINAKIERFTENLKDITF
jgi:hypothetical protein